MIESLIATLALSLKPIALIKTVEVEPPSLFVSQSFFIQKPNSVILPNTWKLSQSSDRGEVQVVIQKGAQSVKWFDTYPMYRSSNVRFVGRAEIVFGDGVRGYFYNDAFAVRGIGGVVIDGGRLAIIPDNSSNVCSWENTNYSRDSEGLATLRAYADARKKYTASNQEGLYLRQQLDELAPIVEEWVLQLLYKCRDYNRGRRY